MEREILTSISHEGGIEAEAKVMKKATARLDQLGDLGWEMVTVTFGVTIDGVRPGDPEADYPDYYEAQIVMNIVGKKEKGSVLYR